jgi:thiaminase
MAIGLYVTYMSNVEDIYIVHITPSAQWKKVYVDIGSQITQYPEGTPYQVYFASYLSSESQSAYGAIDDLRLVQKNSK